ncbi:hypothetical protein ACFE04_016470 [Oxalis oulophora]
MKVAVVLPKHVIAVVKHHRDTLKALQIFNFVKIEQGFKHTLSTYTCMLHKLGLHGHFHAMEKLLLEMITIVDNTLLEPVNIQAMRNYGRKGKVQEVVDVFERMMKDKSFYRMKRPHAALRLLRNMPLQGCELNAIAYCTLISRPGPSFWVDDDSEPLDFEGVDIGRSTLDLTKL